jgi:hypothetical protein
MSSSLELNGGPFLTAAARKIGRFDSKSLKTLDAQWLDDIAADAPVTVPALWQLDISNVR